MNEKNKKRLYQLSIQFTRSIKIRKKQGVLINTNTRRR